MGTLDQGLQIQQKIPGFQPNLFEVAIFGENAPEPNISPGVGDIYFKDFYSGATQPATYYCTAYELPPPALALKRDPLSKAFYVDKYNTNEIVSITWQENSNLDVWNYHQQWMRSFYLREKDRFVSKATGKKRNAHITIQQWYGNNGPFSAAKYAKANAIDPVLGELYTINLIGLVPQSIPPLRGDWNQDASASAGLVIRYYVDYISITNNGTFEEAQ
jgi:hypothetical protein